MPYIITTKRPTEPHQHMRTGEAFTPVSRRAVATLEETRDAVFATLREIYPDGAREAGGTEAALHANALTESGGTVGPLPDGTMIEVEPFQGGVPAWRAQEIIDAYNAKHGSAD